jgi:hypothetical protein
MQKRKLAKSGLIQTPENSPGGTAGQSTLMILPFTTDKPGAEP